MHGKDYRIEYYLGFYRKRKIDKSMFTMCMRTPEEAEIAPYAYIWNEKTLEYDKMEEQCQKKEKKTFHQNSQ